MYAEHHGSIPGGEEWQEEDKAVGGVDSLEEIGRNGGAVVLVEELQTSTTTTTTTANDNTTTTQTSTTPTTITAIDNTTTIADKTDRVPNGSGLNMLTCVGVLDARNDQSPSPIAARNSESTASRDRLTGIPAQVVGGWDYVTAGPKNSTH